MLVAVGRQAAEVIAVAARCNAGDCTLTWDVMVNSLRPIERRVRHLRDSGLTIDEVAWRFRRSPGSIRRILELSQLPERGSSGSLPADSLRPIERVVLAGNERGWSTAESAARLRRSPAWVEQVEALAQYKLSTR